LLYAVSFGCDARAFHELALQRSREFPPLPIRVIIRLLG
jgi:hypothetical protein